MTQVLQDEAELTAFTDLIRQEGCRSYLEVGAKFGGTLERVASVMPPESRIVAVDLPGGTRAWKESEASLKSVMEKLQAQGHDARIIWGDSTSHEVVKQVAALAPFDAILIDANHTRKYVEKDWANYGPMGDIIAFHDISWRREPEWKGIRIDVPEFWNEIKDNYLHQEFKFCPTRKNNGIGVLWR
jgi:predicted O-methyltransferase YrrM